MSESPRDKWAEWLAERRFGGDDELKRKALGNLARVRDRVLDNARLEPGETLVDVGTGEGLIGFGALERGAGTVVFSDVSDDLLATCRSLANELGVGERARFVRASADALDGIDDASADVVTTRSVLIYVEDKRRAFAEFFRVLRPGGRMSLFEPINTFGACFRTRESFWGWPLDGLVDIRDKLNRHYERFQPDSDPMLDFDERDLLELAEDAGFFPVELDFHAEITPTEPQPWETFLNVAGNPKIPSLAEAIAEVLSPDEQRRFASHLRPLVEQGAGTWRHAVAYLYATKP